MCGIVGIWRHDGGESDRSAIELMLPEIEHRGPDGIGIWQDGRVAFGHTRLAVIDLTEAAAQPMLTADRTGAIVYNGEIYNYRELRRDLERQGVSFRSSGDTEVLLNALHHWGPKNCLDRLNGMFAFAYLDKREGALWLARDKVGIKPLIVADTGAELIFASEAKALLAHPRMKRSVDRHEMAKWLLSRGSGPRQILFAGMEEVEPGSVLKITPGGVERSRYFDLVGSIDVERLTANSSVSLDAWPNEFRGRLQQSVALHLESDAPLAMMCSGGVDSSLIAAYAKDRLPGLQAYVADVAWPNAEGDQAARVCQHLGIPLRRIVVDQSRFLRLWPHAVWYCDASLVRPSAVAVLAVARACHADGIKVLLNGEGSDELFGGYGRHQSVYGMWRRRPSQEAFLRAPFQLPWLSEQISSRWMVALDADAVLRPRWLMEHLATIEPPSDRAFLARGLYDLRYHLPWILHRLDRLGMAASIETRVPFLENGLFDFAFHLPPRAKLHQRQGKWLVKQAAAQRLPDDIVFVRKKGFPVPLAFSSGTEQLIAGGMLADFMQWPAETTREIVAALSDEPALRFHLVGLEQWFRMFFDGQSPELLAETLTGLAHEAKPEFLKTPRRRKPDGRAPEALAERPAGRKRHAPAAPIFSGWFSWYRLGRLLGPLGRNIPLNIRVFFYGRVRNVGFQNWLRKQAKKSGVVGWVRNRSDGSIEAVFEGRHHVIEELLAQCRAGPRISEIIVQGRRARAKRQDFWRRKSVEAPGPRSAERARQRKRTRQLRRLFVLPMRRIRYRRLPVAMITGTVGKTTTTRMLAHILCKADYHVGFATTDGVVLGGKVINEHDLSGYGGHALVLKDPKTTAAVLEMARGGLLSGGLYVDRCDVAALLNVGRDHIGIDGIGSVEQMADLKRKVIDAARETVVLNADDRLCCKLIGEYPAGRTTVFSFDPKSEPVRHQLEAGGTAYCLDESQARIVRRQGDEARTIISIADLPSAWGGVVRHNIANAMAAAALAEGLGVPFETIKAGLGSFHNTIEQSAGRFNVIEGYPFLLILDNAVKPPAAKALAECLTRVDVKGRRLGAITAVGNRPSWHYRELTAALARSFDHFVCYEIKQYRRGRARGEIANLLKSALIENGVRPDSIEVAGDFASALRALSAKAKAGDLVVVVGKQSSKAVSLMREAFAAHWAADDSASGHNLKLESNHAANGRPDI